MADLLGSETESVTGDLKNFSIFDITHTLMMSRKTALVTVQKEQQKGYVYFSKGQIVYALDDDLNTGERAAYKIFFWRGGMFRIDFDAPEREKNIKLDTENLLLEIARNMDESERDRVTNRDGTDASEAVEVQFEDRFRDELHRVFDKLDNKTAPTRERYTVSAFDPLLTAVNDLSGSALFLRPNTRPRIKTRDGFTTIKQEIIQASEIEGFLNSLLSGSEKEEFTSNKEISVYYSSTNAGTYQVRAFYDYGRPACIFSPASRSIPPLARLSDAAPALADAFDEDGGLWLLTGPLAAGKTTVLASLLEEGLRRDLLVTLFAKTQTFEFSDESGFMIRAGLDRFSLDARGSLAAAIDQGSDVIAVDEITDGAMFRDAVAVASRSSSVLGVIESEGLVDLTDRVRRFAEDSDSDRVLRRLGSCLRGVVEIDLPASLLRRLPVSEAMRDDVAHGRLDSLLLAPIA